MYHLEHQMAAENEVIIPGMNNIFKSIHPSIQTVFTVFVQSTT